MMTRRRRKKLDGFNDPQAFGPLTNILLNEAGVRGPEKKRFLNKVAVAIALWMSMVVAFFTVVGFDLHWSAGLLVFILVLVLSFRYFQGNRFIRR